MDTRTPLLQTRQLTKLYGDYRALDAVDLTIPPGEIFGLLGPNGSGKSTALRLLLGFMQPSAGTAQIAGFDCWQQSVEVRRRVAYLPGELRLYENMTGRQLIRFLGRLRGQEPGSAVNRLAKRFEIDLERPLTQLSSGMKRKVALLAVLVPDVPLIILDEPTNTLDPTMRDELLDQLQLARQRGQAVLFSSHVLTEVEQVCDRVGILRQGQLVHVQVMAELRQSRRVIVRLGHPPDTAPDQQPMPYDALRADGMYHLQHTGPLSELLVWLERHAPEDLRIEPLGLAPLYQRYHGTES